MALVCAHHLGLQVIFQQEGHQWHSEHSRHALEPLQEGRCYTALERTEKTCGDLGTQGPFMGRQPTCLPHILKPFSGSFHETAKVVNSLRVSTTGITR